MRARAHTHTHPAYVAAAVTWQEEREVCETRAEGYNAKWRELYGCNPTILDEERTGGRISRAAERTGPNVSTAHTRAFAVAAERARVDPALRYVRSPVGRYHWYKFCDVDLLVLNSL